VHFDGCSAVGGYVRVDHGNGWDTTYYHLINIAVSDGQLVSRGTTLGYTGESTACWGGQATAYHVHFSLWHVPSGSAFSLGSTSQEVDWGSYAGTNEQIGDYIWTDGAQQYQGCALQVVTNSQTCWQNYLAQSIYNDGTWAGGKTNLYMTLVSGTNSNKTEEHMVTRSSNYLTSGLDIATAQATSTYPQWTWLIGPYDGDGQPDLWGIDAYNTTSHMVEVHILSAASNYQSPLLDIAIPIAALASYQGGFALGDYNRDGILDLYVILLNSTGSGRVEVHILDGANRVQTFWLEQATNFGATNSSVTAVGTADYNGDGHPDLYLTPMAYTGSGFSEVHVLDGSTSYTTPLLDVATKFGATDTSRTGMVVGDYNADGHPDVYFVPFSQTGSGWVEVHILNGSTQYQNFIVEERTNFLSTSSPAEFSLS
jgi:Peptidase family M23/FG-GAP-like repeat